MLDEGAAKHAACAEVMTADPGPLVIPALALAEVAHLVESRLGVRAELALIEDLATGGFNVDAPHPSDWLRIAQLTARYADVGLGMVDASIVAAAERLGITRIATLDRRHFGLVRPAHTDLFDVVP